LALQQALLLIPVLSLLAGGRAVGRLEDYWEGFREAAKSSLSQKSG